MRLVHLGHACVLVETETGRLLIDPGTLADDFTELTELDAILVTHQHVDHLDIDRLPALVAANPKARLVTDSGSAPQLRERGLAVRVVQAGDALELGGIAVNVLGGQHAVIHPERDVVPNTAYLIEHGAFYHPGDSLHLPEQPVDVLGLPTAAPWMRISEAAEFMRAVAPRVTVPIHERLLVDPTLYYGILGGLAPAGTTFQVLPRGELTEV